MLEFFTISLIIFLAAASPGPDFAIVTHNALRYSQKHGIFTALGVSLGSLIHASYCILGFAIIISKSLLIFNMIKYVGAAYLIYLGIKAISEKQTKVEATTEKAAYSISYFRAFNQGLLCNALNPKAILFFLSLFTMIIKPSMPMIMQACIAVEISIIAFVWFSLLSVIFSHAKVKLFLGRFLHLISRAFGGVLILFGLKIAMLAQR